jgi:transketolase
MLELYKVAQAGHIGSSLSCLDIIIYLHFEKMKPVDKFILSKGHAAAALYTVLNKSGMITDEELGTYYKEGTHLAAHPPCGAEKVKGIIFGTGSLGHGLSIATGLAFSTKYSNNKFDVYCVLSDGDCNEGSTWEAAMFAAQHNLNNLTVVIDNNGLQGFGRTAEVINMEPLRDKWKAFNFEVVEAKNGNDFNGLDKSFKKLDGINNTKPRCIIARTIKGSGISYMEDKLEWHYLPMSDDLYQTAIKEIEEKYA